MNTILGRKIQQTQGFLENGSRIPITVIAAADNPVIGVKTIEKDGYAALQVGFDVQKKSSKALLGQAKKAHLTYVPRIIREIRIDKETPLQPGESIKVEEVLKPGDIVSVTGISKGKGFAGVVKRYHFKGGPRTHGQSDRERAPGSIGQTTTPGRVYKGKRMAGNMGRDQVTIHNLLVVDVDPVAKTVFLKGLVPGSIGSMIKLTKTGEIASKKFVPLFKRFSDKEEQKEEITQQAEEQSADHLTSSQTNKDTQEVSSNESDEKKEEMTNA